MVSVFFLQYFQHPKTNQDAQAKDLLECFPIFRGRFSFRFPQAPTPTKSSLNRNPHAWLLALFQGQTHTLCRGGRQLLASDWSGTGPDWKADAEFSQIGWLVWAGWSVYLPELSSTPDSEPFPLQCPATPPGALPQLHAARPGHAGCWNPCDIRTGHPGGPLGVFVGLYLFVLFRIFNCQGCSGTLPCP